MRAIDKDILTVEHGTIVQSVNCQGPMGGLAGAIKQKWPIVRKTYMEFLNAQKDLGWPEFQNLGHCQCIPVSDTLFVANIFGQWHISTAERQTDYMAIHKGLESLKHDFVVDEDNVYFPYLFASDKGGAKWEYISEIIDWHFPRATICKLPR